MRTTQIFIIEDDMLSRLNLEQKLKTRGQVLTAMSREEAKVKMRSKDFDLAFVDLDLDRELEGLKLITSLKEKNIYTIILSAREEDTVIRQAYELGADDYLVKPFNQKSLDLVFKKFNQKNVKDSLYKMMVERFQTTHHEMLSQIEVIANSLLSDRPILITGETGTGKTYLAKMIHEMSGAQLPFIQVNCSEFTESLLESELFGHVKGAFTGAIKDKKGLIELADGGILFLDEIATMSSSLQKKLLKALEEKEFTPVGAEKKVQSNFRLISATCENLKSKIEKGEFRQDLYFRIEGFNINLIPLRERKSDIISLVRNFIKNGERRIIFEEAALKIISEYKWPGNVRELEKFIDIIRNKDKGIITASDIEANFKQNESVSNQSAAKVGDVDWKLLREIGLNAYIQEMEMQIVEEALKANNEKVRKTLTDLKLSNNTFYRILDNIKTKGVDYV